MQDKLLVHKCEPFLSALYLLRTNKDMFAGASYVGITERQKTILRLREHIKAMRAYLKGTTAHITTADKQLAKRLNESGSLFYNEVQIRGISHRALRILEDSAVHAFVAALSARKAINMPPTNQFKSLIFIWAEHCRLPVTRLYSLVRR